MAKSVVQSQSTGTEVPEGMPAFDPATLQIRWNRLITIMDEVDAAIIRTSFSTIVGESRDFGVVMLDQHARSVAQSQMSSPAFTCSLPTATRSILEKVGADTVRPGDVLFTNDPWLAHGHLPDFYIVLPLFHGGSEAPVGFLATAAHVTDIGGKLDGLDARDLYEEGLRVPPTKMFIAGQRNDQLFDLIEANSRVPAMVLGDVYAIIGSMHAGAQRFEEMANEYGIENFHTVCEQILTLSEKAMRDAIREIPDGVYTAERYAEGYDEPIKICAKVEVKGDSLSVDYAGSSDQTERAAINVVMNVTHAHTLFPLKASLLPDLPNNEGLFRPITASAPLGSIFNARFPAAVRYRTKSSYHLHNALYDALAPVIPDKVQAGSGSFWSMSLYGQEADGRPNAVHVLPNGGKGATMGDDGLTTTAFPGNGTLTPIEIIENNVPVQVLRREIRIDSGGAGEFRGGLGQEIAFKGLGDRPLRLRLQADKMRIPAPGILGGGPGAVGEFLADGVKVEPTNLDFEPGKEIVLRIPGGGGFGDPKKRDRNLLQADIDAGYVSEAEAIRIYDWAGGTSAKYRRTAGPLREKGLPRSPTELAADA
jgi:N-methylhydantoinase B